MQQIQYSISVGSTWADNGADCPSNLANYPNMLKLASRVFEIPKREHLIELALDTFKSESPVEQLLLKGYKPMARFIWRDDIETGSIVVAHVVVPGLETLNNLIFNQPILPTGRLRTEKNIDYLLEVAND